VEYIDCIFRVKNEPSRRGNQYESRWQTELAFIVSFEYRNVTLSLCALKRWQVLSAVYVDVFDLDLY
jgi:hypothetical protein